MRRPILIAASLLLVALVAACGDDTDVSTGGTGAGEPPVAGSVDGRAFLSESVTEDGAPRPLVEGTRISLAFDGGTVRASVGCNQFGGDYVLEADILVVTGGAMTEMGCDGPLMAQDDWLFGLLAARPSIILDGDQLTVTAHGTVIRLLDEETANPDRDLTGVRWTLHTIVDGAGDDAAATDVGVEAWIELDADGTFTTNLGCNGGSGRHTVEGDRLVVSDLVSTQKACSGEAGRVETAMTATLQAEPVIEVDADQLSLFAADRGLVFEAAN